MNDSKTYNYSDYIRMLYSIQEEKIPHSFVREITFQITDDCPMACTYCYQINKSHNKMSLDTSKKIIDLIFDMYYKDEGDFINKQTKAVILDFIGGEPFMAIDIIEETCDYFVNKCLEFNHPWLETWRIAITSNGALYFEPKVQNFIQKFKDFLSLSITIDGPKEVHDACRIYHDGRGNFEDAHAAQKHYCEYYNKEINTKVTIAPENLKDLSKIFTFFVNEGFDFIPANTIHEVEWTYEQGTLFYNELKKIADILLECGDKVKTTLFEETFFEPMDPEKENGNWCGGTGDMLAFDPQGNAYPCLRYMPSSLGDVSPIIVGNIQEGIFTKKEWKKTKEFLDSITRRSQSSDECFNCPIGRGCAWCSAWNY